MQKNKPIKFAHNFIKLFNQSRGKLIEVVGMNSDMITSAARDYDTVYLDTNGQKQYYELPQNCSMVRLTFAGSLGIPVMTFRRLKDSSWVDYARKLHEEFDFVVDEKLDVEKPDIVNAGSSLNEGD